jgi:hypothetical protein
MPTAETMRLPDPRKRAIRSCICPDAATPLKSLPGRASRGTGRPVVRMGGCCCVARSSDAIYHAAYEKSVARVPDSARWRP